MLINFLLIASIIIPILVIEFVESYKDKDYTMCSLVTILLIALLSVSYFIAQ